MLAVLLITALFVVLSVYFFLRAEKSQQTLLLFKREAANTLKENTLLTKSIALIASNHEEFAKSRLQRLLANNTKHQCSDNIELIKPLINNYIIIFSECLKGKGKLQAITKKCYESQNTGCYQEFISKIVKKDRKIQRLWSSNNLIGFISLVEALLIKYDTTEENNALVENVST